MELSTYNMQKLWPTDQMMKIYKRNKDSSIGDVIAIKFNIISNDITKPGEDILVAMIVVTNEGWTNQSKGFCNKRAQKMCFDISKRRFFKMNHPKKSIKFQNHKVVVEKVLKNTIGA